MSRNRVDLYASKYPMKLSVAMITYNQERYIGQAIESVLAQKVNFDYEIVIGEDCSTDSTREIVMDFQRRYRERIVPMFRERNLGPMQNIESVLTACRGQYLTILEGDDYWTSVDKLQKQVDLLDAHPDCALCCHRVRFLGETGTAMFDVFPLCAAGTYTIEDLLKLNFVMTCSAVMRRDQMRDVPPWLSEVKVGDWARSALVATHGTIELMDEIMAAYRVHAGGMWSSLQRMDRLRETARMMRALDKQLEFRYTSIIIETAAQPYLDLAIKARIDGKQMETGRHLLECLRNGGWRLPVSRRLLAGLAAYTVFGSWYEAIRRAGRAVFH
jgi:glycosyltransferase involved in cell wall biosynthesis